MNRSIKSARALSLDEGGLFPDLSLPKLKPTKRSLPLLNAKSAGGGEINADMNGITQRLYEKSGARVRTTSITKNSQLIFV